MGTRVRESRYRDDYSSDDDRSSYGRAPRTGGYQTTVSRYKVAKGRGVIDEYDDDRRSVRDTRLEVAPRVETERRVERVIEREPERRIARPRSFNFEREPFRDPERERDREPLSARGGWERERSWDRERDTEVRVERRSRLEAPYELERYQRETEYYSRPDLPPQPIVIRQRAPEPQQIFVEAAPLPVPVVIPQERQMVRREEPQREEEYYYDRREVREVGPRRDEIERYERRRSPSDDGYSDGSEVVVRKERRVVRSKSSSPHHKRHLAEGALAGAGAAAILARHREKSGAGPQRKGVQVASGAALGAIGAQLVTRARSHYREKSRNREFSRSRSRSSSRGNHNKLRTGLGVAAVAIAAAAAGKYLADRKSNKRDDMGRGRSRTRSVSRRRRYSTDDEGGANIKHDAKHRAATIAKAGAGAAAVAGLVEAIRSKSQQRNGQRSKSRLRTGGAIAATGLAGAAVAGLYEARKAKQDRDDEAIRGRNARSRSRSRARSIYTDPVVDPELGLVEYGANPVYTEQTTTYTRGLDPAIAAAPAGYAATPIMERSHRRHRSRSYSPDSRGSRSRSRSRIRDIAGGALATGAAAIGINQYQRRKERKKAEREERRRYEEDASAENYYANESYDDGYSPSPPRASGGAFYPQTNAFPPPPAQQPYTTTHTTETITHVNDYPPQPGYNPVDYPVHPADYPPNQAAYPPAAHDPYFPPQAGGPTPGVTRGGEHVSSVPAPEPTPATTPLPPSEAPLPQSTHHIEEDRLSVDTYQPSSSGNSSPTTDQPHNKSVTFAPLSPTSSRHLKKVQRKRRNSDPSSDRPDVHRSRNTRSISPEDEVEVLPDRFDSSGRPLERDPQQEMVERITRDVGDVLEGRATWRDLLSGIVDDVGASNDGRDGGRKRRR